MPQIEADVCRWKGLSFHQIQNGGVWPNKMLNGREGSEKFEHWDGDA